MLAYLQIWIPQPIFTLNETLACASKTNAKHEIMHEHMKLPKKSSFIVRLAYWYCLVPSHTFITFSILPFDLLFLRTESYHIRTISGFQMRKLRYTLYVCVVYTDARVDRIDMSVSLSVSRNLSIKRFIYVNCRHDSVHDNTACTDGRLNKIS